MQDRDLTVPNWIDLICPGCGGIDGQVNGNAVNHAFDPDYLHDCGYRGPFEWINPDPPSAVWALRRAQSKHLLSIDRNMDNPYSEREIGRG